MSVLGAPSKRTRELEALLMRLAAEGMPKRHAARCAGIAYSTLMAWLASDAVFSDQYRQAESNAVRELLKSAWTIDPRWVLARRWPADFGKKREEHKPVAAVNQFDASSVEALTKASEELRRK